MSKFFINFEFFNSDEDMSQILSEQEQYDVLREKCSTAKERIWIASPFIGNLADVKTIIDGKWMSPDVDFRILTDADAGFIRPDSFDEFLEYGAIRSLKALHAKIYIVDDWCLVTSANLTGTAFMRRYEMGVVPTNSDDVVFTFEKWWSIAEDLNECPTIKESKLTQYQDGLKFKKLFKSKPYTKAQEKADKYKIKVKQMK